MSIKADPRLIVGLDMPSVMEAHETILKLADAVNFYKVGLTLLSQPGGVTLAHDLRAAGNKVFQDWKLHDIGAQVEGAARSISEGGCDFLTVHAQPQVMAAAVKGRGTTDTKILAVTVLTSLSDGDLGAIGYTETAAALVERRVMQALDAGVDGVVSSPHEARRARELAVEAGRPDFLIVTPGIRPAGADKGDQQRAATPAFALKEGASHLVVARPILQASDPKAAAVAIIEEMA